MLALSEELRVAITLQSFNLAIDRELSVQQIQSAKITCLMTAIIYQWLH